MATATTTTLKTYFNTGDKPTQQNFFDLLESYLNLTDGGVVTGAITTASVTKGLVTLTATDAITAAEHAGRTLVMADSGGDTDCVFTLPAATGTGNVYHFIVGVVNTSTNGYKIQVADATDTIDGSLIAIDDDGAGNAASVKHWPTVAATDTIQLDGDTTGGAVIGDWICLTDIAANQWAVSAQVNTSGTIATPFSAAVS